LVARDYATYAQTWVEQGIKASALTRHVVALYHEVPGARLWRRHISEHAARTDDVVQMIEAALQHVLSESGAKSA